MTYNRIAFVVVLVMLGLISLAIYVFNPLDNFDNNLPPEESLIIERVTSSPDGFIAYVRGNGREPIKISQIQVDGAFWDFRQIPDGPINQLATAKLLIPYPWIQNETHHLLFLSSTGATYDYTIDVAYMTPSPNNKTLFSLALIGICVGVIPITLGMLSLPLLRLIGDNSIVFFMSLTIGLLGFLFVDTLEEGLELTKASANAFQGNLSVLLASVLTFLGILTISWRSKPSTNGIVLATWLAIGIGLHNFGEGLSIGAALSLGNAALGSMLLIGFSMHNLTEGVAIIAPITKQKVTFTMLFGWLCLAGLPAIVGTWVGAFTFAPHWNALFFGIAAGAIAQVIIEVGRSIWVMRSTLGDKFIVSNAFAGFGVGILVMYTTAFLIQV
jgi:ZIP family zinc transporter